MFTLISTYNQHAYRGDPLRDPREDAVEALLDQLRHDADALTTQQIRSLAVVAKQLKNLRMEVSVQLSLRSNTARTQTFSVNEAPTGEENLVPTGLLASTDHFWHTFPTTNVSTPRDEEAIERPMRKIVCLDLSSNILFSRKAPEVEVAIMTRLVPEQQGSYNLRRDAPGIERPSRTNPAQRIVLQDTWTDDTRCNDDHGRASCRVTAPRICDQ